MSQHETKRPVGVRCEYPTGVQPVFPLGCEGVGDEEMPNGLNVYGAGESGANMTYALAPTLVNDKHWWSIMGYRVEHDGMVHWLLRNDAGDNLYSATGTEALPPQSGWVAGVGAPPAPTIEYVYD